MTIWLRRSPGLDSNSMREIADEAGVSWDVQSIVYRAKGIGYANGDEDDATAIQDAAENILGYRPRQYDPPDMEAVDDTS